MDVHGGKGVRTARVHDLARRTAAVPIGITVEGANIVTRRLIQFGQGAIRGHPYLLKEMAALEAPIARAASKRSTATSGPMSAQRRQRAARLGRAWSGAMFAPAAAAGQASRCYRPLGRYASAFALAVDVALLSLGGALARQGEISARRRRASALISSPRCSSVLRTGREEAMPASGVVHAKRLPAHRGEARQIFANFPDRPAAWLLRFDAAVRCAPVAVRPTGWRGLRPDIMPDPRPRASARPSISSTASATTGRAPRARLRARDRGRAATRAHAPCARARHRPGADGRL